MHQCHTTYPSTYKNLTILHLLKINIPHIYQNHERLAKTPKKLHHRTLQNHSLSLEKNRVERIVGTFLFYGRAVDATILNALRHCFTTNICNQKY